MLAVEPSNMNQQTSNRWGVAGVGTSGTLQIDVDVSDDESWEMTLYNPKWHLRFAIPDSESVSTIYQFIDHNQGKCQHKEIKVGCFSSSDVLIVKDSEFADRFFIVVRPAIGYLGIPIVGEEVSHLLIALREVLADLREQ